MTKHPQNRAERLRLKKAKFEAKQSEASHIRRRLKTQLQDQETQDALRKLGTNDRDPNLD